MIRLSEKYKKEAIPAMMEKFGYKNIMAVPKIKKVVINTSFGKLISGKSKDDQKKTYEAIMNDLAALSGQQPILTNTKKSIASFKTRKGIPIGAMVTLRKSKMFDFLERLIYITLPRSRDFRGIKPQSIDQNGNLTIALKEQIDFPEISQERIKNIFGLEMTIVTNSKTKEEGLNMFKLLGFPMKTEA
ncbi:MAG: 50S ribosomal protein L5 [Patescibacteria group bacterium]|nr:50S ribosomal protein L5 [Patescibacteria group bacterium]